MSDTFTTFTRSCRNWQEFSSARKITQDEGLTFSEAQAACKEFNDNRSQKQIDAGTKMEFTAE